MQTCVIAVDFNEGRSVYEKIRNGIEGKDIAILGKSWCTLVQSTTVNSSPT